MWQIAALPWLLYSMCTVANGCAPCVKTGSHFIFSWWHIPPSIPSPVAPCFFSNDLTVAMKSSGGVGGGGLTLIRISYPLQLAAVSPLHPIVFQLDFRALCLETTLLVRMCFTCAGPAEVIKASAALCWRGCLETRSFWRLTLAQAVSAYKACKIRRCSVHPAPVGAVHSSSNFVW